MLFGEGDVDCLVDEQQVTNLLAECPEVLSGGVGVRGRVGGLVGGSDPIVRWTVVNDNGRAVTPLSPAA